MEITFKSKKLKKRCESDKELVKAFGDKCAKRIRIRHDDLKAASNLEDFKYLPGRCHPLTGNRDGQFSLDLEHPYRLIFQPSNEDITYKDEGGLDWKSVKAVKIIGVEDTHD